MTTRRRAPETVAPRILAALLLALALVVAAPIAASAHTPNLSATCSTLSVNLQYYHATQYEPTPNIVIVSVDGVVVLDTHFGQSLTTSFPLGDATLPHTWSVTIDAVDAGYDSTTTGTTTPCAPAVPRDASAAVVLSVATCTAGETVALGALANAEWGDLETTATTYSVTATAIANHLFDDGMPTRVLSGTLSGPLLMSSPECAPAPVVETQEVSPIDCESGTVTTTTTTTTTGWIFDSASSAWIPGTPSAAVTSTYRPVTPEECPVTPPDEGPDAQEEPPVTPDPLVVPMVSAESFQAESPAALPRSLAHNGVDPGFALLSGIALLGAGLGLRRIRRPRTDSLEGLAR